MEELKDAKLKRPMDRTMLGADVAGLDNLLKMVNNPELTGAVVPPGEDVTARSAIARSAPVETSPGPIEESFIPDPEPPVPVVTAPEEVVAPKAASVSRIFLTGRISVGKDHCATAAGLRIVGLADPLYFLAHHFFGVPVDSTSNKDLPGMRNFLQDVGQWGRGEEAFSPMRAIFTTMIRSLAAAGRLDYSGVDWAKYGADKDIWLNALFARLQGGIERVAVSNVRFENEYERFAAEGWKHWHVVCSPATWRQRLQQKGLTPDSPQVKNVSENLARKLDADLQQRLSRQRNGPKLRVIWNDTVPCPSPRLYTLEEFQKIV